MKSQKLFIEFRPTLNELDLGGKHREADARKRRFLMNYLADGKESSSQVQ
jgi:hypothetical protein